MNSNHRDPQPYCPSGSHVFSSLIYQFPKPLLCYFENDLNRDWLFLSFVTFQGVEYQVSGGTCQKTKLGSNMTRQCVPGILKILFHICQYIEKFTICNRLQTTFGSYNLLLVWLSNETKYSPFRRKQNAPSNAYYVGTDSIKNAFHIEVNTSIDSF